MVDSGIPANHVSIISDNAKKMNLPAGNGRRRRAPRRSISTPLHHMSRWDSPSKVDVDAMNHQRSLLTRSRDDNDCRWESMCDKRGRVKSSSLTRPQRKSSFTNDSSRDKLFSQKGPSFSILGKEGSGTASLPKSLRSLPY